MYTSMCVHPEIVDFGSGQGLSVFATTGIVSLFRGLQKSENEALGQKMLFPDGHRVCFILYIFASLRGYYGYDGAEI